MSDIAIRVENLSKLYRIGERERYYTLRDTLANTFTAPFRWFRQAVDGRRPTEDRSLGLRSPVTGRNGHIWALKDVSFEVKRGEVVGVIGRNGAGKTTLLKILSRITEPTEGYAEIHGRVGSLLEVGTGFHPELTGRENIYLNGAILGMKKTEIDRKFDEIVAFAEVEKFIDTPVKHFSSGMYLRLAFSVAAHLDPEILLVDEVLAVGDVGFQKKCLGKMGEVTKEGRTVLFVSHNMHAISTLCRSGLLLDSGRVIVEGDLASCIDAYAKTTYKSQGVMVDASELTRTSGCGDRLRIIKVVIQVSDGSPRVPFNSPLIIDVEFISTRALSGIVLGLGVNSFDGVRVLTCHSDDSIKPFNTRDGACYRARFSLPQNELNPGLYNLDVIARSGSLTLDYLTGFMQFEVLQHSQNDNLPVEDRRGLIRPSSVWDVDEIGKR